MYEVLGRSAITLNHHDGEPARQHANNLRLYEATGMGAALVTDRKENLGELFDVGRELVDYGSADEALARIAHLREHPDEAAAIAAAGEARTLSDHTYARRMAELVELVTAVPTR
jgi:spore maturation protein CgeB